MGAAAAACAGAVEKDGEEYFALHNPHNKMKSGFGPVRDASEGAEGIKRIHRTRSLTKGGGDMYKEKAADSLLVPRSALSESKVFTSCILFSKK